MNYEDFFSLSGSIMNIIVKNMEFRENEKLKDRSRCANARANLKMFVAKLLVSKLRAK